jgi:DNA-binding NtrC family response regulator
MTAIWVVCEDPALAESLAQLLADQGEVRTGPPERAAWRDLPAPDLLLLAPLDASGSDLAGLERLLAFAARVRHPRRPPPPVLFLEPASGEPSASVARALIDDRPVRELEWPLDPQRLAQIVRELALQPHLPASLRERTRRTWVSERVERLYADLDLPALRHAVDPRNAHRPVLLVGEHGTRRELLARYIHNLAEPERERFAALSAPALRGGELEPRALALCAGARATLYLDALDAADAAVQREIAEFLGASGALALEPIRWIASATRAARILPELRLLPWIRVALPAVRERADRGALIGRLLEDWNARAGQRKSFSPEALAALSRYAWPGNLRELEASLDATLANARGDIVEVADLRLGPRLELPSETAAGREPVVQAELEPHEHIPSTQPAAAERRTPIATEPVVQAEPEPPPEPVVQAQPEPSPATRETPGLRDVLPPLAREIRQPLLAIRTYASLLQQRPDDPAVRRELTTLVDEDLGRLDADLARLETYLRFGEPRRMAYDLAAAIAAELDRRQDRARARALVVLRELDFDAPRLAGDEEQMRFAIGALLDRALRMIPRGGDLYVGSLYHPPESGLPGRHRLLIRFHSPEEVLIGADGGPEPTPPLEVVLARDLVERVRGSFAVDASGAQDNVVLIELPAD